MTGRITINSGDIVLVVRRHHCLSESGFQTTVNVGDELVVAEGEDPATLASPKVWVGDMKFSCPWDCVVPIGRVNCGTSLES